MRPSLLRSIFYAAIAMAHCCIAFADDTNDTREQARDQSGAKIRLELSNASFSPEEKVNDDVGLTLLPPSLEEYAKVPSTQRTRLLDCDVVLRNETGKVVEVTSNFGSAFDGLSLVILKTDGTKLGQIPFILLRSPFSLEAKRYPLKIGENHKSMCFSAKVVPDTLDTINVVLIGTLPGNDNMGVLCSNMVRVERTAKKDAP